MILFFKLLIMFGSIGMAEIPERIADVSREHTDYLGGLAVTDQTFIWHSPINSLEETDYLVSKIGRVYPVNSIVRHIKTAPGKKNGFDVIYRINEFGQRILDHEVGREKHLIVAGDSHTFGIGVKDSETLQAILAKDHPQYQTYNFGHGGGSVNNTLSLMENFPWEKNIHEKIGKMIYLFSATWMFDRVMGTKDFIIWDGGYSPWYYLKNDQLIHGGSFNDRFLTKVLRFITWIDRFHWIGDLPKVNVKDFRLIAKILVRIKAEYLKKFPEGEFIVAVSYYGDSKIYPMADKFMTWLKDFGMDAVAIQTRPADYKIENILVDYHFNYGGQKVIAKELGEKIKF